jgi:hypothetical protein
VVLRTDIKSEKKTQSRLICQTDINSEKRKQRWADKKSFMKDRCKVRTQMRRAAQVFFQNPSHFHTDWLIFEGLATKINQNQIQKYLGMSLLGPKPKF